MPLILISRRNARRSVSRAEAEEKMRILAHDEMREQRDLVAHIGQVVERAHRHVDLVGDALDVEQNLRRILFDERAGEASYHGRGSMRTGALSHALIQQAAAAHAVATPGACRAKPSPPCAWQIAHASASAASLAGAAVSASRRFTISCTCCLGGLAVADDRLLDLQRRVLDDRNVGDAPPPRSPHRAPARAAASTAD